MRVKKLLMSLMAIIIVLSISIVAFSEEKENNLIWKEFGPLVETAFEGEAHFDTIEEVEAKIWIPDKLTPQILLQEDKDVGAIRWYSTEDETFMIYITYINANGMSLDTFQEYLLEENVDAEMATVNEIPCVIAYNEDKDVLYGTYLTSNGYFFHFLIFLL